MAVNEFYFTKVLFLGSDSQYVWEEYTLNSFLPLSSDIVQSDQTNGI